jgi:hypothetical protein
MEEIIDGVYERFSGQRKQYEQKQADEQDMQELRLLEESVKSARR